MIYDYVSDKKTLIFGSFSHEFNDVFLQQSKSLLSLSLFIFFFMLSLRAVIIISIFTKSGRYQNDTNYNLYYN